MSIKKNIDDALLVFEQGRKEEGFLSALNAAASLSKSFYPEESDLIAFEQFLSGFQPVKLSVEYRKKFYTIEHLFYTLITGERAEGGGLPNDIALIPDQQPGLLSINAAGEPDFVLKLSESWFHFIVNAVVSAESKKEEKHGVLEQEFPGEMKTAERAEWLKQMRDMTEALYDHVSPGFWATFGVYANGTHREYLRKFLALVPLRGTLLSAACGAGRYDGMLLDAGNRVVGIDQSGGMLAKARARFPEVRYEKTGLQEMNFRKTFEGVICIDAMEHVCPEDWPGILRAFCDALKPGGVVYFTLKLPGVNEVEEGYERARAMGLPVVFGEVADKVEAAYQQVKALEMEAVPVELPEVPVYNYYPALEQVRAWIRQAGFTIEDEGMGNGYEHFVVMKK